MVKGYGARLQLDRPLGVAVPASEAASARALASGVTTPPRCVRGCIITHPDSTVEGSSATHDVTIRWPGRTSKPSGWS